MQIIEIPLFDQLARFKLETDLRGKPYNFEFEWIERGVFWLMHIKGVALGIRFTPHWPLLREKNGFPGQLILVEKCAQGRMPTLENLKRDFSLVCHAII